LFSFELEVEEESSQIYFDLLFFELNKKIEEFNQFSTGIEMTQQTE